jgi:hypothetical protein
MRNHSIRRPEVYGVPFKEGGVAMEGVILVEVTLSKPT